MVARNMEVAAMVMCFTGEVRRNVNRPSYISLHEANLVIVRDGTRLIRWKDRFALTQGDELTSEFAEALIEEHANMATV